MGKLPIQLSTYNRDYGFLPYLPVRNIIVEQTPGATETVVLLPRPGLSVYRTIAGGGSDVKAVWQEPGVLNGDDLCLSGSKVFRAGTSIGTLATAATAGTRFAASTSEVVFSTGGKLYRTDGLTVSQPTFPDGASVAAVGIMDNYFLAVRQGSGRLYWSAVNDGTTWPALNYAAAESRPDNLIDVVVINDQIAVIGQESIEFWQANPTGDQTLPFTRIDGLTYSKGAMNTGAAVYADNTLIWVGNDAVVYRRGAVPLRISDSGVEEQLKLAGTSYLSYFNWAGHALLLLTLPTQSFFYDFQTKLWSEVSTYGFNGWRAQTCCTNGVAPLFADSGAAQLLQLDDTQIYDAGATVERRFAALLDSDGIVDNLWLDAQGGIGSEPSGNPIIVEVSYSRDGSQTFGPWIQADLGKRGEYRKRAVWRRLGRFDYPGGVFWFRCTDAAPFVVQSIRVNEDLSGRSV